MFKHTILATIAATCFAAPAFAQAAPVEIELEGEILSYNNVTRTLDIMGMKVEIPTTTRLSSPTNPRPVPGLTIHQWFNGVPFPGRALNGMIGGTGIVLGIWDAARNVLVASEVAAEPSENVIIGVVTGNWCSTANCDGATDYIRGNTNTAGAPGPAYLPIRDIRMPAGPVKDETGFALNLSGANLRGLAYASEGYYGDIPVTVQTGTSGQTVQERSFHYFIFDLIEPSPQFFLNKTAREISVLRTDCRTGERFEMTGHIHSRVNPNGTVNDTVRPNNGVVEVVYTQPNGTVVRRNTTATVLAANSPIGRFRARFDAPGGFCPTAVTVRWVPTANQVNPTTIYASMGNVPVEVRTDDPADD